MFLRISPRSLSVSGFTPPTPSRTSSERESAVSAIEVISAGDATSTVAFQRVTAITRSWPAFAATPSR
jgi:dolichol kinase